MTLKVPGDLEPNPILQIPRNPAEPCELCYCIRNHTACVMQECTLRVPGCEPIYQAGVCCPVKYMCDDGTVIGGNGLPDTSQVYLGETTI